MNGSAVAVILCAVCFALGYLVCYIT